MKVSWRVGKLINIWLNVILNTKAWRDKQFKADKRNYNNNIQHWLDSWKLGKHTWGSSILCNPHNKAANDIETPIGKQRNFPDFLPNIHPRYKWLATSNINIQVLAFQKKLSTFTTNLKEPAGYYLMMVSIGETCHHIRLKKKRSVFCE